MCIGDVRDWSAGSQSGSRNQTSVTEGDVLDVRWIARIPPQVSASDTAASTDIPAKLISDTPAIDRSDKNATMATVAARPDSHAATQPARKS